VEIEDGLTRLTLGDDHLGAPIRHGLTGHPGGLEKRRHVEGLGQW
jgi:hypothetical protein